MILHQIVATFICELYKSSCEFRANIGQLWVEISFSSLHIAPFYVWKFYATIDIVKYLGS